MRTYLLNLNHLIIDYFSCSTLSGLVEFDGFYLESDPCLVCNNPEVPFSVCIIQLLLMIDDCMWKLSSSI